MKEWNIRLIDMDSKNWNIVLKRTDKWNILKWQLILNRDGDAKETRTFLPSGELVDIVRMICLPPPSFHPNGILSKFEVDKEGKLQIQCWIKDGASRRRSVVFPSSERKRLGDLLKEIPILQALGILEKGDENDPGRVEERSNL